MPRYVRFFAEPFEAGTAARRYNGRRIHLLKIDCEGCHRAATRAATVTRYAEMDTISVSNDASRARPPRLPR
eukprot:6033209-Prymnesium_polylepis.1